MDLTSAPSVSTTSPSPSGSTSSLCSPTGMALQGFPLHHAMEVSKTGALSSGFYMTRTGEERTRDVAEQFSKQVSKVFLIMFAVRLVQHREQKDEDKIIKNYTCVVD